MEGDTNSQLKNNFSFEISLVIIAILIPLFLESFPSLIDRLVIIFPIFLKLDIIRIISFLLGLIWFMILLIGLAEFNRIDKKFFKISFLLGRIFTFLFILTLSFVYVIYLATLWLGAEKLISLFAFLISILFIILEKGKRK